MIQYLKVDEVLEIRKMLKLEPAEIPYMSEGGLKFTLEEVKNIHEDITDERKKIASKAAYLLHHIVTGHFFMGGNKRTGLLIVQVFLAFNDLLLKFSEGDGYLMVMGTVRGNFDQKIISSWIEKHMSGEMKNG